MRVFEIVMTWIGITVVSAFISWVFYRYGKATRKHEEAGGHESVHFLVAFPQFLIMLAVAFAIVWLLGEFAVKAYKLGVDPEDVSLLLLLPCYFLLLYPWSGVVSKEKYQSSKQDSTSD